jgi:uncharacterized membrane protein
MHILSTARAAAFLAFLAWAATAHSQTINYTTTQVPTNVIFGSQETRGGTSIRGLNDGGEYVGAFGERNWVIWNTPHSFIHTNIGNLPTGVGADQTRWGPEGYRLGEVMGTRYTPAPLSAERFHYLDLKPEPYDSDFNAGVSTPNAINNAGVSTPNAINNAGVVVGGLSSDYLNRGPSTAFVFNSRTGDMQTLNVLGAISSFATDINNSGQIVGTLQDAAYGTMAFFTAAAPTP